MNTTHWEPSEDDLTTADVLRCRESTFSGEGARDSNNDGKRCMNVAVLVHETVLGETLLCARCLMYYAGALEHYERLPLVMVWASIGQVRDALRQDSMSEGQRDRYREVLRILEARWMVQ